MKSLVNIVGKKDFYSNEGKKINNFALVIFLFALAATILTTSLNYLNNLEESLFFGGLIFSSLLLAMFFYFILNRRTLGTFISVIGSSLGVAGVLYFEGRISFNFMFYFAILFSTPFLIMRDKNFAKKNNTLFLIVSIIALISLLIAPTYPTYDFLKGEALYDKRMYNSVISLSSVILFSVMIVYSTTKFILMLLKEKETAETEKDKRIKALYSLGHELRTQINSINGIIQLISEQKEGEEIESVKVNEYARLLDKCNVQMLDLVNDVLDTHKIESGKFELVKKPESLSAILISTSENYKTQALKKNLEFRQNINSEILDLAVLIDKERFKQILKNLLSNAIKYTEKGFVSFNIDLLENTETTATLEFSISDSGIGISKENYSQIFESFQQIKREDTDIYGGTGLGLSLTKTILHKMNSDIAIESELESGSTFSFVVTLEKATKSQLQTETDFLNNKSLEGKHILIAEDNAVNMLYTSTLLEKFGITVYKAKNGQEAVDLVKTTPQLHTVLLDLEMPILNGFEAIKQIKECNASLSVIAFTASKPNEALVNNLYENGFNDFITKPFKKEDLLRVLL